MIDAFMRLMNTNDRVTGPINLGNPVEFKVRELAEKIIDLTGSSSQLEFKPLPEHDPRQRKPDIQQTQEFLGWNQTTDLDDGLRKRLIILKNWLPKPVYEVLKNSLEESNNAVLTANRTLRSKA